MNGNNGNLPHTYLPNQAPSADGPMPSPGMSPTPSQTSSTVSSTTGHEYAAYNHAYQYQGLYQASQHYEASPPRLPYLGSFHPYLSAPRMQEAMLPLPPASRQGGNRRRHSAFQSEEARLAAKEVQKAKRREQNRIAQRRLRDRKEEHIHKLETEVDELREQLELEQKNRDALRGILRQAADERDDLRRRLQALEALSGQISIKGLEGRFRSLSLDETQLGPPVFSSWGWPAQKRSASAPPTSTDVVPMQIDPPIDASNATLDSPNGHYAHALEGQLGRLDLTLHPSNGREAFTGFHHPANRQLNSLPSWEDDHAIPMRASHSMGAERTSFAMEAHASLGASTMSTPTRLLLGQTCVPLASPGPGGSEPLSAASAHSSFSHHSTPASYRDGGHLSQPSRRAYEHDATESNGGGHHVHGDGARYLVAEAMVGGFGEVRLMLPSHHLAERHGDEAMPLDHGVFGMQH